jgi:hypothetical protein
VVKIKRRIKSLGGEYNEYFELMKYAFFELSEQKAGNYSAGVRARKALRLLKKKFIKP